MFLNQRMPSDSPPGVAHDGERYARATKFAAIGSRDNGARQVEDKRSERDRRPRCHCRRGHDSHDGVHWGAEYRESSRIRMLQFVTEMKRTGDLNE